MKKALLRLALLTYFLAVPAWSAGILKSGYIMCTSEEALDNGIELVRQGKSGMLRSVGCYRTQDNLNGAVLDRGFSTSKVLIQFANGDTATVVVPSEAIAK